MIEKLKQEMARQGINARELSMRANLGSSFIYDLLSGRSTNPTTNKMVSIANALGVSLSDLHSGQQGISIANKSYENFFAIPFFVSNTVENKTTPDNYLFNKEWVLENLKTSPETLRMVMVSGDGMYPFINNKDMVLIDIACKTPMKSGVFILLSNSIAIARRIEFVPEKSSGNVMVFPDNPKYSMHSCHISDLDILGRAVWVAREI